MQEAYQVKEIELTPNPRAVKFILNQIVLDSGYDGYIGIEYEGNELEEMDGILATKKLLERVGISLS